MNENKVKDLTRRVSQASEGQLLAITYEILLDSINSLKTYIQENIKDKFMPEMKRSQKILQYLMDTLNMDYELSYELMNLYLYMQKLMTRVSINKNVEHLDEIGKILTILLKGWQTAGVSGVEPSLMQNSQKVYAGLTYGKGALNEYLDSDEERGFKA